MPGTRLFVLAILQGYFVCLTTAWSQGETETQQVESIYPENKEQCNCEYFTKGPFSSIRGCRIVDPAPPGFKCKCEKGWPWQRACRGITNRCDLGESCQANCFSKLCCRSAGGNCKGYFEDESNIAGFRKCLQSVNTYEGRFIERSTNRTYYDLLNHQWNLILPKVYPLGYFLPLSTEHVQTVVQCGIQNRVHLTANSGGHSYEGLCFGTGDNVVVDFRLMNKITVHAENQTATIGPGAMIGQIYATLWKEGGFAIPMGNCLNVGLGGHGTGGGDGYYSAQYGVVVDNVVEFTVVTPKGVFIATEKLNPDLYWAFRGVGPAYFGMVTQFKLKLFNAAAIKTTFVNLHYDVSHFPKVMDAFQKFTEWVATNQRTVAYGITIVPNITKQPALFPVPPGLHVQLLQIQDPVVNPIGNATFLEVIDSTFPEEGRTTQGSYGVPHLNFVLFNGYVPILYKGKVITNLLQPGAPQISELRKEMALKRYLRAKTFFVKKRFSLAELERVGQVLDRMPTDLVRIQILGESGAIADIKPDQTAYIHRNFIYQIIVSFESLDKADIVPGMKWLMEFWDTIQFMDGGNTYQGMPDLSLPDYLQRYYGSNLERLKDVKNKFDPTNFFSQRQSFVPRKN